MDYSAFGFASLLNLVQDFEQDFLRLQGVFEKDFARAFFERLQRGIQPFDKVLFVFAFGNLPGKFRKDRFDSLAEHFEIGRKLRLVYAHEPCRFGDTRRKRLRRFVFLGDTGIDTRNERLLRRDKGFRRTRKFRERSLDLLRETFDFAETESESPTVDAFALAATSSATVRKISSP